jgi:hypothetical protein
VAQLAATNSSDLSYQSPWAVELAERAPDVRVTWLKPHLEVDQWCLFRVTGFLHEWIHHALWNTITVD